MIRINLLEVREERRKLAIRNLLIVAGLVWSVTFLVLWFWHSGLTSQIEAVRTQTQQEQQEIQRLNTIVADVEKVKDQKKDLEEKLDIIRNLESSRAEIVDLLLAVSEILPEEIWLDSLSVENNQINMSAYAVDMQSIGLFVKKLKEDPRFSEPSTKNIKANTRSKGARYVSFQMTVDFAPPQEPEEEKS